MHERPPQQLLRTVLLPAVLLALVGCSFVPEVEAPDDVVPGRYPQGPAYDSPATEESDEATPAALAWQDYFPDDTLTALIGAGLENNTNLERAALRIAEARAAYGIEGSRLYPAVAADGSYVRQKTDAAGTARGAGDRTFTFENYRAGLGITAFEFDFFGRLRSLREAALSDLRATRAAEQTVRIALIADIARSYTTLRADQALRALAAETVASRKESLEIIARRARQGVATDLELAQAESLLAQARVDLHGFVQAIARDRNRLRLLLGTPDTLPSLAPATPRATPGATLAGIVEEVPVGLPSELMTRRPDIVAAEERLRAANADIGAARAAFFPAISLTANGGYSSDDLNGLFDDGSQVWRFAPQISLPIFTAGRLQNELELAEIRKALAVNRYERTIETAFREVADALAAVGTLDDQLAAQEDLVAAAAERVALSTLRHEAGIENYLAVLDARREHFTVRQNLIRLRREAVVSRVALFSALGGDGFGEAPGRAADDRS